MTPTNGLVMPQKLEADAFINHGDDFPLGEVYQAGERVDVKFPSDDGGGG